MSTTRLFSLAAMTQLMSTVGGVFVSTWTGPPSAIFESEVVCVSTWTGHPSDGVPVQVAAYHTPSVVYLN